MTRILFAAALLAVSLGACGRQDAAEAPPAVEVTDEATGRYCGMLLVDHPGPKGQIHLASQSEPVWFSSVRDTIAFTRLPEEPDDVLAIYVNDMGRAADWNQPGPDTWIEAREAWFVIGSDRTGGMGEAEAVPFGTEQAAAAFAAEHQGRVVRLDDVPTAYILGPKAGSEAASAVTGNESRPPAGR